MSGARVEAMRLLVGAFLFLMLVATPSGAETVNHAEFWSAFRTRFPFPLQDIFVSPISPQGEAVVILSEPPPSVWHAKDTIIKGAFGESVLRVDVMTKRVGFDGWAKDIVVTLRGASESSVRRGVANLSHAMHGTDYGASFRTLDPKSWDRNAQPVRRKGPPNLQINAASLHEWLFASPISFLEAVETEPPSSPRFNLAQLLRTSKKGVFHSVEPGLVLLVIDREVELNRARPHLWRFLLDTDALVGAVSMPDSPLLVLVGRSRTTSLSDAPPLSTDTILTLAATRERNLAQSYERTSPLAGPVNDEGLAAFVRTGEALASPSSLALPRVTSIDWAPILLSRELINTEYGQLLNIADQMLKGWSMSNGVVYGNFPYPAPGVYPDANGIFHLLEAKTGKPLNQLTFNWNTAGFGTWTRIGDHELFTVLNTGALPVSYIPDEVDAFRDPAARNSLRDAEDQYGRYFAAIQDPYLTRVAQYAALHVIFVRYPVVARRTEPLVSETVFRDRWGPYQMEVEKAIRHLAEESRQGLALKLFFASTSGRWPGSCGELAVISALESEQIEATIEMAQQITGSSGNELSQLIAAATDRTSFKDAILAEEKELIDREAALAQLVEKFNRRVMACTGASTTLNALRHDCARLRQDRTVLEDEDQRQTTTRETLLEKAKTFERLARDGAQISKILSIVGDCAAAWKAVTAGAIDGEAGSSVRTPSIVVSASENGQGTGGHNLDGRSVEIIGRADAPRGTISVSEDGNLLSLNPSDLPKATAVAREFERSRYAYLEGGPETRARIVQELQASLKAADSVVVPFGPVALGRITTTTASVPSERGRSFVGLASHDLAPVDVARANTIAAETGASVVVGRKNGLYTLTEVGPPPVSVATRSPADLLRAVETKAREAASDTARDTDGYVIVTDGSLTLREMDGLRVAGDGRQIVADASGGGAGIPPSDRSRLGTFFGDDPRSPSGRKKWFTVSPFDLPTHLFLKRRDADWAKARLDPTSIRIFPNEAVVVVRLVIPFKTTEPSAKLMLRAMFKRRQPTQADADAIVGLVGEQLRTTPDGTMLARTVINIRNDFQEAMKDDAELRMRLTQDKLDFVIVELESHEHFPRHG